MVTDDSSTTMKNTFKIVSDIPFVYSGDIIKNHK